MLLDFTFSNYRSVNTKITLSMERVTKLREEDIDPTNVVSIKIGKKPGKDVLKSAIIFGANGSGKSNIVMALAFFRRFIMRGGHLGMPGDPIPVTPFAFSEETPGQPSMFEMRFLVDEKEYRYGFEATTKKVTGEWLYRDEKELFVRERKKFSISKEFSEGENLDKKTRSNALFLPVCASFDGKIAEDVVSFVRRMKPKTNFKSLFESKEKTVKKRLERILPLIKRVDTGISHIELKLLEKEKAFAKHTIGDHVYELPVEEESDGTQRLINVASMILDVIDNDGILIIDEFDSSMHPLLSRELIRYFHKESKQAQLIITTHDPSLIKGDVAPLGKRLFRRDQMWFTEKHEDQATELYSLAEFKSECGGTVRQDEVYEKNYLAGRYGGVPVIDHLENFEAPSKRDAF